MPDFGWQCVQFKFQVSVCITLIHSDHFVSLWYKQIEICCWCQTADDVTLLLSGLSSTGEPYIATKCNWSFGSAQCQNDTYIPATRNGSNFTLPTILLIRTAGSCSWWSMRKSCFYSGSNVFQRFQLISIHFFHVNCRCEFKAYTSVRQLLHNCSSFRFHFPLARWYKT